MPIQRPRTKLTKPDRNGNLFSFEGWYNENWHKKTAQRVTVRAHRSLTSRYSSFFFTLARCKFDVFSVYVLEQIYIYRDFCVYFVTSFFFRGEWKATELEYSWLDCWAFGVFFALCVVCEYLRVFHTIQPVWWIMQALKWKRGHNRWTRANDLCNETTIIADNLISFKWKTMCKKISNAIVNWIGLLRQK